MTVDGTKVVEGSARKFAAIGGGWAVKMNIKPRAKMKEESMPGIPREMVIGQYASDEAARDVVRKLNAVEEGNDVKLPV